MNSRPIFVVAASVLGLALAGCAGKPPLPKYASVDSAARPSSPDNFAALVPEADVVYFPVENASHGGRSDPAAQLLAALQQTGAPIMIAWDIVDVSQQPLLDQFATVSAGAREDLIAKLDLEGTGRTREFCRTILRSPRRGQCSPSRASARTRRSPRRISLGEVPAEQEQAVPRGFRAPAGDAEAFQDRFAATVPATPMLTPLIACISSQSNSQRRESRTISCQANQSGKLLVFLSQSDLEPGRGVPFFVTQKVNVRQLVLGSDRQSKPANQTTDRPRAVRCAASTS